ncbi:MAG: hypothetical protein VB876_15985 [Pirellulales bacterium]
MVTVFAEMRVMRADTNRQRWRFVSAGKYVLSGSDHEDGNERLQGGQTATRAEGAGYWNWDNLDPGDLNRDKSG